MLDNCMKIYVKLIKKIRILEYYIKAMKNNIEKNNDHIYNYYLCYVL